MPPGSVSVVITDPPYGLSDHAPEDVAECLAAWLRGEPYEPRAKGGFMGRSWDAWVPGPEVWREAYRVLKPGGHVLAFAGSRTLDLMSLAIRLAGFELRDTLQWLYGTGFPKSLDVSQAIDKLDAKQEQHERRLRFTAWAECDKRSVESANFAAREVVGQHKTDMGGFAGERLGQFRGNITAPATPEAKAWEGWGTALKPAYEPIVLARKPLAGTVAANVLAHGTGAINIDATRVPYADEADLQTTKAKNPGRTDGVASAVYGANRPQQRVEESGRFPTNVLLDDEAAGLIELMQPGASRIFYSAKASPTERPVLADGYAHPTVKPLALMRWLVRLATPPGGLILDPFAGSGTTIEAAMLEGHRVLGIEADERSVELCRVRIERARSSRS